MTSSPVLLLVPGAFGTPAGYDKLLPYLTEAGFSTRPGPYPSCNPPDPATATAPKDVAALRRDILLPLIEQEKKDVVIIAHSYGGGVAGGAAKDLDKATRQAQGQEGGVIGLIYVAGNITLEGEGLIDTMGGKYPPFIKLDKVCRLLLSPWKEPLKVGCTCGIMSSVLLTDVCQFSPTHIAIQGPRSHRASHGHSLQRL